LYFFFDVPLRLQVVGAVVLMHPVYEKKKKNRERPQFKPKKCTPVEEMVQIMKQNAELRKSKILKNRQTWMTRTCFI
jgi:hypothetical protein